MDGAGAAPDPATALGRLLRAPLFAATTVALAVLAHVVGGGMVPPASLTVELFGAVALLWLAVGRREVSLVGLCAGMFATQLGIHLVLLDGPAGHDGTAAGSMVHHGGAATSPAVLAAHLGAGLALAALLRRHEIACWREWICCRLTGCRLLLTVRPTPRPTRVVARCRTVVHSLVTLVTDPLRGPPQLV